MTFFKSNFSKVLEKCTSNLLLEPDWDGMLQLCDFIRGNDIKTRDAVAAIKKTLEVSNPHQQYFGYCVLDTVVKNCGAPVHQEVVKRAFLEQLKDRLQGQQSQQVQEKILDMIQTWGIAGRSKPEFKLATDLYSIMKVEGYEFPDAVADNELIVDAAVAPVWKEGDECFRCKTSFGVITRKHHCRACGNIFCDKCSSKSSTVPKFGIEKEVRVCDSCYAQLQVGRTPRESQAQAEGKRVTWADDQSWQDDQAAVMERYHKQKVKEADKVRKSEDDARLKEQEELDLAIALSLDEAEQAKKNKESTHSPPAEPQQPVEPEGQALPQLSSDNDNDLQKYLDRSYWEQRNAEPEEKPVSNDLPSYSQTMGDSQPSVVNGSQGVQQYVLQNDTTAEEVAEKQQNQKFCKNLSTSLDIFMNRMKADQARGKPISADVTVQTLFKNISELHPNLLELMQKLEDKRTHWEGLSDKVNAITDARTALDALRNEHGEEMKRRAEEAERQRQIQLAQKLEMMRQKKREYLESQRAATLARMAESQAALHAKREAQRNIQVQKQMPQPYHYQYQPYAAGPIPNGQIPNSQPQQYNQYQHGEFNQPIPQNYNQQQMYPPNAYQNIDLQQQQAMQQQVHPGQIPHSSMASNYKTGPVPQVSNQVVTDQMVHNLPSVPNTEPPQQAQEQEAQPVAEAQLISFD